MAPLRLVGPFVNLCVLCLCRCAVSCAVSMYLCCVVCDIYLGLRVPTLRGPHHPDEDERSIYVKKTTPPNKLLTGIMLLCALRSRILLLRRVTWMKHQWIKRSPRIQSQFDRILPAPPF